jgi:hypothetical protein
MYWTLMYDETRKAWSWRCVDRNGEPHESPLWFQSFAECVEDAKEHGFAEQPCEPAYH